MNVFVLATCRKEELLPYTTLVFRTLRVGFPTAEVIVTGNDLPEFAIEEVMSACEASKCSLINGPAISHDLWLETLIDKEQEPFWICDTDIIFYSKVEDWTFSTALAGFRVPEFFDEFTNAITRSRLHTSLLYIDPKKVCKQILAYESQFPVTPFNPPPINPFAPICIPLNGRFYFHDVGSILYHAIGGTAFNAMQKNAFFHFNFGTIQDEVLPRLQNGDQMKQWRDEMIKNPERGRGAWRQQEEYYSVRQPQFDGTDVIAPTTPAELQEADGWNMELCKGNVEAMAFGNSWYAYVHAIDDLLDTMQDGRPTMSKDQMLSVFFGAAILYNCPFYIKNQKLLFPIILDITNTYKVSVAWENSPQKHLRAMADVMRSCGSRMHSMVALICGGELHMQEMSRRILERDYIGQHDAEGNPI